MLETLLGPIDFSSTPLEVFDVSSTPHILLIRQQSLQVCNFVVGHLQEYPIRTEEVHRAQNAFRLRALLLRSLEEVGEWEDLVKGIEVGINALTPQTLPADSVRSSKTTLDNLLLQIHYIGKSIYDIKDPSTSSCDTILWKHP